MSLQIAKYAQHSDLTENAEMLIFSASFQSFRGVAWLQA
jgi:hypothetical protein